MGNERTREAVGSSIAAMCRDTVSLGWLAYFLTTMSAFVVPTMSNSSFCSAAGTLNASRDFWNSLAITPHSLSLMFR